MYPIDSKRSGRNQPPAPLSSVSPSSRNEANSSITDKFYISTKNMVVRAASASHSVISAMASAVVKKEIFVAPKTFPGVIDWNLDYRIKRSDQGRTSGVYFISFPDHDIENDLVLKPSRDMISEFLAFRLASEIGILTPRMGFIENVPQQCLRFMSTQYQKIIAMEYLIGKTFSELQFGDKNAIVSKDALSDIGKIIAFDYLIGNPDRFPVKGLGGSFNNGNLMFQDGRVWAIDNTFSRPKSQNEKAIYTENLEEVLSLVKDPGNQELAKEVLGTCVRVFPKAWGVDWDSIREHIIPSFIEGIGIISMIEERTIIKLFKEVKKIRSPPPYVEGLLQSNWKQISAYRPVFLERVKIPELDEGSG
jgi:hypothetical protein